MYTTIFKPTPELTEKYGIREFCYSYMSSDEYKENFKGKASGTITPNVHYLLVTHSGETDFETGYDVYSNKWEHRGHPNKRGSYLKENSIRNMWFNKKLSGMPTNVMGRRCILVYPRFSTIPFIFDTGIKTMFPFIEESWTGQTADSKFMKTFGDCSHLLHNEEIPKFRNLNIYPCGETASNFNIQYLTGYGIILNKIEELRNAGKQFADGIEYIVYKINDARPHYVVYSNKWSYGKYADIPEELRERNSAVDLLNDYRHSGKAARLAGHRVIICYPFKGSRAAIWDTETSRVWVLPLRKYPENSYYMKIVKCFGEIIKED